MISELEKLFRLTDKSTFLKNHLEMIELNRVNDSKNHYPLYAFSVGSKNPEAPVVLITGGFHGIERIGAQLAWSLLKTTLDKLIWDESLQEVFHKIRLVTIPLVNPTGYYNFKRCNYNGVDLMRNSPTQAIQKAPLLLGGHRYSNKLPWFRGEPNKFEIENLSLIEVFNSKVIQSSCVISLDLHSGFGMRDRLWFPFSYTDEPFNHLAEMYKFSHLLNQTHPYHVYKIEPQSDGYLLSGDMWDYLYLEYLNKNPQGVYLPMTLEMGSWNWVRKNPLQMFSREGVFNPIKEHRIKRTFRRHYLLYDFIIHALYSNHHWAKMNQHHRGEIHQKGLQLWYK